MSLNLISGSMLERVGYALLVLDSKCRILTNKGEHIYTAHLVDGLYVWMLKNFLATTECQSTPLTAMVSRVKQPSVISSRLDVELLHKRFGHANIEDIVSGLRTGAITGYTVDVKRENGKYQLQNGLCTTCMKAKAHKPPFYSSTSPKATIPAEYVVCDIQGPYSIETNTGQRYVLTYTDWYARYS
jgi:hypothetical protein